MKVGDLIRAKRICGYPLGIVWERGEDHIKVAWCLYQGEFAYYISKDGDYCELDAEVLSESGRFGTRPSR